MVRRERNRANKTRVKNIIRQLNEAIEQESVEQAQKTLKDAAQVIQKVAAKGTFHKNTASRKVSRLTKRVNKLVNSQQSAS